MRVEQNENRFLVVSFSPEERLCFSGALNEVCNGFQVADFERQIGISREGAKQLHTELKKQSSSDSPRIELTVPQLAALRNALTETLRELGIEEFETRVGIPFEDARKLERHIVHAIELLRTR